MENRKTKKPTLMPALWLTVVFLAAALLIWLTRPDTVTLYFHTYGEFSDPVVSVEDETSLQILSVDEHEGYTAVKVKALRPGDGQEVYLSSSDGEYNYLGIVDVDSRLRATDWSSLNFTNWQLLYPLTLLWIAACTFIFFNSWRRQMKYSVFSYNTIIYFGFGLMGLVMTVVLFGQTLQAYKDSVLTSMLTYLGAIYSSVHIYAIISFPVLFILTLGLVISNIMLWRKEGRGFTNMVATIFGVILTLGNLAVIIAPGFTDGYIPLARIQMAIINALSAVFLYLESMWLGTVAAGLIVSRMKADCDRDYLIILGCGMRSDGTPTPLLRGRCDQALNFYHRQLNTSGRHAKFIPSGGQGSDEPVSESECMKNYLISQGIREDEIIMENRSTTTMENFQFSKELIPEADAKCAFFTTKYHVFRSGIWARRAGFERTAIQSEGASTKWYFWPNAFVREFAGLLSQHRLKQALIICGLMIFYGAATLLLFY